MGSGESQNFLNGKVTTFTTNHNAAGVVAQSALDIDSFTEANHQVAENQTYSAAILTSIQNAHASGNDDDVSVTLTTTYIDSMKTTSEVRITEAGFRLAGVLDGLFGGN